MSHHYSGPEFSFPRGNALLDFTDLYAFPYQTPMSRSGCWYGRFEENSFHHAEDYGVGAYTDRHSDENDGRKKWRAAKSPENLLELAKKGRHLKSPEGL